MTREDESLLDDPEEPEEDPRISTIKEVYKRRWLRNLSGKSQDDITKSSNQIQLDGQNIRKDKSESGKSSPKLDTGVFIESQTQNPGRDDDNNLKSAQDDIDKEIGPPIMPRPKSEVRRSALEIIEEIQESKEKDEMPADDTRQKNTPGEALVEYSEVFSEEREFQKTSLKNVAKVLLESMEKASDIRNVKDVCHCANTFIQMMRLDLDKKKLDLEYKKFERLTKKR